MPSAFVTGASRGFGRLIVERLAAAGWHVVAGVRDPAATVPYTAGSVDVVPVDVTSPAEIAAAAAAVERATGGWLDAVVPNAGVAVVGAFEETPPEDVRRVLETNVLGVMETVQAVLPQLRRAHGRVVLISSDCGIAGAPGLSAYVASKFAVEGWGEALAYELEPLGVAVSIIQPGPFATDIWSAAPIRGGEGAYASLTPILAAGWRAAGERAAPADPVADTVLRALSVRRPRLRYRVGRDARLMAAARRLLPSTVMRAHVRRVSGIGRWRPKPEQRQAAASR